MYRKISDSEIQQHLKSLDIYGYAWISNYLDPAKAAELKNLVDKLLAQTDPAQYAGRPARDVDDKMVYNLQYKDKRFIDLLTEPTLTNILTHKLNDRYYRFLPDNAPNYVLAYYNARSSGKELDLHIDSYIPAVGPYTWVMQAAFVLEDMTEQNGCTVVVPGSHQSGKYTDREFKDLKPVHAKAGDLLLWDSRLWHGTEPNKTKATRWTLIATLTQWWVKQTMDIPKGMPQEIYKQLSNEQKALLGFCSIPPRNEVERINTKCGYDFLKPHVEDYWK